MATPRVLVPPLSRRTDAITWTTLPPSFLSDFTMLGLSILLS